MSESGEWHYEEPEISEITIGEAFQSNERQVWYSVYDEIGKDGVVNGIYVVEDGLVTAYEGGLTPISLGQVSTNGDDWAISVAEDELADLRADDAAADLADLWYFGPTNVTVTGHTDSTGNTVVSETVMIGDSSDSATGTEFDINSSTVYSGQVFDNYYLGFDNAAGTRTRYLVTIDTGIRYVLDTRDSEYLDYWD